MNTQISITVLKESFFSRFMHFTPIWARNEPTAVNVYIDDENAEPLHLEVRNDPYLIDVEPGAHALLFKDADPSGKNFFSAPSESQQLSLLVLLTWGSAALLAVDLTMSCLSQVELRLKTMLLKFF